MEPHLGPGGQALIAAEVGDIGHCLVEETADQTTMDYPWPALVKLSRGEVSLGLCSVPGEAQFQSCGIVFPTAETFGEALFREEIELVGHFSLL
jgi:hypothetical protein